MAISSVNARWGRTSAPEHPEDPVPAGLSISRETADGDPVVNVVLFLPRYRRWLSGAIIGFPSLLMVVALSDSHLWFMALFCLAFVLSALLVFVPDWRTRREIDVTPAYITFSDAVGGGGGNSETIATRSIRSIALVRARWNVGHELLISAEEGPVRFGAGLSKRALIWLRDYLMKAARNA